MSTDLDNALVVMAQEGKLAAVKKLIKDGANINVSTSRGLTPFMAALKAKEFEVAEYLLSAGADLGRDAHHRASALRIVIDHVGQRVVGAEDMALIILSQCDIEIVNETHGANPPMHILAMHDNVTVLQAMIDKGAEVDYRNADKRTPLMRAGFFGAPLSMDVLIKAGAEINALDCDRENALHRAMAAVNEGLKGAEACTIKLIEAGIDLTRANQKNILPLHQASARGAVNIVKAMVAAKVNLNVVGSDGYTALLLAAEAGYGQCVKILLDAGADPHIKKSSGLTPADAAAAKGHTAVVEIFKQWEEKCRQKRLSDLREASTHGLRQPLKPRRTILKRPPKFGK